MANAAAGQKSTLAEMIYDAVTGKIPGIAAFGAQAKDMLQQMIELLDKAGWKIVPPGALPFKRQIVPNVEPDAFWCPHCGVYKPAVGFSQRTQPGPEGASLDVMTAYYMCCRNAINIAVVGGNIPQGSVQ